MKVGFSEEKKFTKEQKQDLMHVATCVLLAQEDYYLWEKNDEEGWPHYTTKAELPHLKAGEQSVLMKEAIVNYFVETGYIK